MSDTEKFVRKLQECAHNREPITLFGANYVPADDVGLLKMIVAGIEVENVRLRELVKDLWKSCPVYTADCYGCEYHQSDGGCRLYERMRELGIEVDG